MSVDLDLIPYRGKMWPRKATLIRYKKEYHIRNWSVLFFILEDMQQVSVPDHIALVKIGREDEEFIDTGSCSEGLKYLPASKVATAIRKALKEWVHIEPINEFSAAAAEEEAEAFKKMKKILAAMKRLKPSTPVILSWW